MAYGPLMLLCVAFVELLTLLKPLAEVRSIVVRSREALRSLASTQLGDDDKERIARDSATATLLATTRLLVKFLLIGLVLYLLFMLATALLPGQRKGMMAGLVSPFVIAVLTIWSLFYAWVRNAAVRTLRKRSER